MAALGSLNLTVDESLPIAAHQGQIAELLADHQVVIVAGETGSGKTTQLPKICLALGRKRIGHTQPRRIAARAMANRIAEEIGTTLGDVVGYQVRFTDTTSKATRLKLMTDGILLAEIGHDKKLTKYDTIIIDEAHERSLNIDFLLGYLKQLLPSRPDLKLIITSATIDTQRFSRHFDDAPVVEVGGRGYPVEIRYEPVGIDDDLTQAVVTAVSALPRRGDILVFCSGEREIRDLANAIGSQKLRDVEVLPLFARLTMAEQARVFAAHTGQRVVLATNVAETSLTVPGIRFVVDPGFARISRYSARTKVQRLPIEPISIASANQRAGRCGRVAPGVCVRLYSEEDLLARPEYTEPEILRTNLASVILAMANARLGNIADFPFVEAPDQSHISDGLRLLAELGAISAKSKASQPRLTRLGHQLANLPVDPRLGRMLLEGARQRCLRQVLIVVAALSIQDVREYPLDQREQANAMHARFGSDAILDSVNPKADTPGKPVQDPGGDIAAILRIWTYLQRLGSQLSSTKLRKRCRAEFLNYRRIREWQDLEFQLRDLCRQMQLSLTPNDAPIEAVLTACLSGLLSNIGALDSRGSTTKARRMGPREYNGTRGARFAISLGSLLAKGTPQLVMAASLVETTRLWAHTVAAITPEQVEQVGSHMLARSYSEPFFSVNTGKVLAHEKVLLLGVTVVAGRQVGFETIDPEAARQIFIQSGLVEQLAKPKRGSPYARVVEHNAQLRASAEELEDKARFRGMLVDDAEIYEFFNSRIPLEIMSMAALDRWLRQDPGNIASLQMTLEDLLRPGTDVSEEDFPDVWSYGPAKLELDYHFSPGDIRDGVSVGIPLATLGAFDPAAFTWGIPGSRQDLAVALIRTLPKSTRTRFVPASAWAKRALDWLAEHGADESKPFTEELSRALLALSGETVSNWNPDRLPNHLKMGFQVKAGDQTEFSLDLLALRDELDSQVAETLAKASDRQRLAGTTWVFGQIPESIEVSDQGLLATGYPGLKDEADVVTETLSTSFAEAQAAHHQGLVKLALFVLPDPSRWIVSQLAITDKLALGAGPYPSLPDLIADARLAAVSDLVDAATSWQVRDAESFSALVERLRLGQVEATQQVVALAAEALRLWVSLSHELALLPANSVLRADLTNQIDELVFSGFLSTTPKPWRLRVPVWLQGAEIRLQGAELNPGRDDIRMAKLAPVLDAYQSLMKTDPELRGARDSGGARDSRDARSPRDSRDDIKTIGYLIQELRLQTFAQTLRTIEKVSEKRLLKAIAAALLI